MIGNTGTQVTFLAYGVTCVVVFFGYVALIFLYVSKQSEPPPIEQSAGAQPESVYLAPHGVPGGIPRSPSKAKGACTSPPPSPDTSRGGSRKKYLGAWPLIIWEAITARRNYYRTNYITIEQSAINI